MYKPSHSTIQSEKLSFDSIATRHSLNSKHLRRKLPTSFLCEISVQRIALGWFCTTTFGSIWICKAKQTTPESSSLKFKHRPYKVDATATSDPQKSKEHHAFGLKFLKSGIWKNMGVSGRLSSLLVVTIQNTIPTLLTQTSWAFGFWVFEINFTPLAKLN